MSDWRAKAAKAVVEVRAHHEVSSCSLNHFQLDDEKGPKNNSRRICTGGYIAVVSVMPIAETTP